MRIENHHIASSNSGLIAGHQRKLDFISAEIPESSAIIDKLVDFQIAIPSWALGTGGTRFGRFSSGGEPRNIEEKIEDIGLLHKLNGASGAISLHIPWDTADDPSAIKELASAHGLRFDAMNSNTFQDSRARN